MKSRGLEQVELFLSDGVVGMKTALAKNYPQAHFQRCLVHVMRNICAKVRVEDREAIKQLLLMYCMPSMPNGTRVIIMS